MLKMENPEEVLQILERFTRLKQKEIPKELDDYLQYVAKTGDTVFKWASLKYLFREKLLNVMKHFHETTPRVDDIPQCPNVDPFNYENMKSALLERLELFNAAPFTIQRLCELLIDPRKQYSRTDKFMRALEKNILVVSTIEPGRKLTESENGDSLDSVVNGDISLDVNVDIDMDNESLFNMESQNGNGSSAMEGPNQTTLESKGKSVVVNPNAQQSVDGADDDLLPNPKKAKLDLDKAEDKPEQESAEEIKSDNILVEEPTEDSLKIPERAELSKGENASEEILKPSEPNLVVSDNPKNEEILIKKTETDSPKPVDQSDAEKGNVAPIEESETKSGNKSKIEGNNLEKDDSKDDELVVVAKPEKKLGAESEEKIVEKQEIETGEKSKLIATEGDLTPTVATNEECLKKLEDNQNMVLLEGAPIEGNDEAESKNNNTQLQTEDKKSENNSSIDSIENNKVDTSISAINTTEETEDQAEIADDNGTKVEVIKNENPLLANASEPSLVPIEKDLAEVANTAPLLSVEDPITSTEPPILALNDQPMEDVPVEEVINPVEEVVMAESSGSTDMTTESIDTAKDDELAGMDVDDTSQEGQEAMDQ